MVIHAHIMVKKTSSLRSFFFRFNSTYYLLDNCYRHGYHKNNMYICWFTNKTFMEYNIIYYSPY